MQHLCTASSPASLENSAGSGRLQGTHEGSQLTKTDWPTLGEGQRACRAMRSTYLGTYKGTLHAR